MAPLKKDERIFIKDKIDTVFSFGQEIFPDFKYVFGTKHGTEARPLNQTINIIDIFYL
jgi:hypothetical protein